MKPPCLHMVVRRYGDRWGCEECGQPFKFAPDQPLVDAARKPRGED